MFPYVCLATMPLFCENKWPRKVISFITRRPISEAGTSDACVYEPKIIVKESEKKIQEDLPTNINWKHKLVVGLLLTHCGLQVFLPYSHFITKVFQYKIRNIFIFYHDLFI